ncbi:ubiquitin-related modifier 1 homolog [Theileria orientalis strain Shintoku]|uniref:Ubiquitin-related modifier 1 homolog n=1 Tax=Theileria orientalis strain Shintoku TaxID=869250 RepID=J4DPG2_THEOR|nr:ubiquitin-related modifier 1 homolog [Theileria orientalis strain Shintoku]PVC54496.1 ubiquitin-related modifier 1-like protein [Theileria orientalis]BAM40649.1 ubiquitin-related modifier 1 homolog [Theileria orientalis strain Shintoku]|eukprot:XP_009690950.1 ubiquitin-related modifier 1 homolog [Theileria orientalis strain Shintoku]
MEQDFDDSETNISLEFSGGLDSLILNQERDLKLKIRGARVTIGQLIAYIRRNIIGSKKDFFSFSPELTSSSNTDGQSTDNVEDTGSHNSRDRVKVECNVALFNGYINRSEFCKIRPGVLVLVNDVDWELLEKEQTALENHQNITFISTLHGG